MLDTGILLCKGTRCFHSMVLDGESSSLLSQLLCIRSKLSLKTRDERVMDSETYTNAGHNTGTAGRYNEKLWMLNNQNTQHMLSVSIEAAGLQYGVRAPKASRKIDH